MNWGLCGESLWIPGGHTEDGHVHDGDKWALTCNDSIHGVWTKNTLMNFPDFLDLAF